MNSESSIESRPPNDDIFGQLDFSGISFPSDKVTIAMLRKRYPESFDRGLERFGTPQPHFFPHGTFECHQTSGPSSEDLGTLLFAERLVAAFTYAKANGLAAPGGYEGEVGLDGFKRDLVEFYTTLHLASGEHHAQEMIRDIERQALLLSPDRPR